MERTLLRKLLGILKKPSYVSREVVPEMRKLQTTFGTFSRTFDGFTQTAFDVKEQGEAREIWAVAVYLAIEGKDQGAYLREYLTLKGVRLPSGEVISSIVSDEIKKAGEIGENALICALEAQELLKKAGLMEELNETGDS